MTHAKALITGCMWIMAVLLLAAASPAWRPGIASAAEEASHILTYIEADQFEYRWDDGEDTFSWDAQGWAGGDHHKVLFKTQGDAPFGPSGGSAKNAEVQVLYGRAFSAFWDLQAGVRYDIEPDPTRGFAVVGIQGLAPYFFEVDAAAFVSDEGDASARLEVEYEILLTQRLIARPSAELNFAAQEVEELGIGSGLSEVELGLQLRYEFVREFAPYIGVSWERTVGPTADFARRQGDDVGELTFVSGVRFWY